MKDWWLLRCIYDWTLLIWLSFEMANDGSLLRNQFITRFQTLLHLGYFGSMFCSSGSSLLKTNILELFSHTWTAIWADTSSLSPQSKFSEFIQLKWPFQFTAVTKIPSSSASFAIGYTSIHECIFIPDLYIYYAHTHRGYVYACMYKNAAWNFNSHVPKLCVYISYGNSGKTQKVTSIFYIHTAHLLKDDFKRPWLFKHLL